MNRHMTLSPGGEPMVTVVVPARNEAAGVGACLESLLRQDYAKLRMIAVDDRSTDKTGAILDGLVREHGAQLEVIHVAALPEGWLGKTHAMALAARQAMEKHAPDYLLFTDADVVFRQDALRRSLVEAVATRADHFVAMPTTLVKTQGEGMLLAISAGDGAVGGAGVAGGRAEGRARRNRGGRVQPDADGSVPGTGRI